MSEELEPPLTAFDHNNKPDPDSFKTAYLTKKPISGAHLPGGVEAEVDVRVLTRRKQQVTLRDAEKICRLFEITPETLARTRQELSLLRSEDLLDSSASLAQYLLGCAFGRWDIRFATGERPAPEPPAPFDALPVCPLGQLQNARGLPAFRDDVPSSYPVPIPWDGILVDDPHHPLDIEGCLRQTIGTVWKDRAEAIELEALEILAVKSLRDYFRKPAGFFADHLKRYSKSRRQAPIYWPISTTSGSYTIWLYYHRLTDQTLHKVLADFVDPKIKEVERNLANLREQGKSGTQAAEFQEWLDELKEFRAEIERAIKLPWKPNLNDGVLITACPLWRLFRLSGWRNDLEACWNALEAGEYDWAHLAHSIWPERVKAKCKTDRSLAIAHGLEHLCTVQAPAKKAKKQKAQLDLEDTE